MTRSRTLVPAAALVVALSTTLGGCWLQPGHDAALSRWNAGEQTLTSANVDQLTELWSTAVPTATLEVREPISVAGTVFATARDGDVAAIDAGTGDLVWHRDVGPTTLYAPTWHEGALLVPGQWPSGGLHKLRAADGTTIDVLHEGGIATHWASITDDGRAAIVTEAYDGSGQLRDVAVEIPGREHRPEIATLPGFVDHVPQFAMAGDRVLWTWARYAVSFTDACPPAPPYWVTTVPCGPEWGLETSSLLRAPALVNEDLVAYTNASDVMVLDVATGEVEWKAPVGTAVTSAPVVADGVLLVTAALTEGPRLVAFPAEGCGAETCAPLWDAPLGGAGPATTPVAGGDVVYVADDTGHVRAFALGGCGQPQCDPLADVAVGSTVSGGPIVDDGRLLVGTADGRVVALGLPPG